MRSTALGLLMVVAIGAGCATARNTPAQNLAWERWQACDHFSTIVLDRVELDGRLVVTGYQIEARPFAGCVERAAADQGRRGIAVDPSALVFVKTFGCLGGAM